MTATTQATPPAANAVAGHAQQQANGAPVLIMAGGTGGHIFPGIAVAHALQARGVAVRWLGSRHGLENRLVPGAGLSLLTIDIAGLRGKRFSSVLSAPPRLLRAIWQAARVLRQQRPRCVLSLGGFAAAPGGIAAWLLRVPLLVHEQNRIPGLTNRLLARLACRTMSGFPDAFPAVRRVQAVGNPVRSEIAALPPPAARGLGRRAPIRLLVIGGSQGARALNLHLPASLGGLAGHPLDVLHQCGPRMLDEARAAYRDAGVDARVEPFIADMAAAYGWADLAVCRAGALTIAELAAAGLASILVPFPAAVDDHQTRNAEFLVDAGAARLIAEGADFTQRLQTTLLELITHPGTLLSMAEAARHLACNDAADRVAVACMEASAA